MGGIAMLRERRQSSSPVTPRKTDWRDRSTCGWRSAFLTVAVVSLILLPSSQAFSEDNSGGLAMVEKGEKAPGKVATYSRANYVWPFAKGPYYGKAGEGRAPGLLYTQVGVFDLNQGQIDVPDFEPDRCRRCI